jgi:GNAT superfamily N-acetyltransferase
MTQGVLPIIEPAQPEDAEAIQRVSSTTWLATYPNVEYDITEEDIRRRTNGEYGERIATNIATWTERIEAADETTQPYVARLNGTVVGFANAMILEGVRYVGAMYVLPEAQQLGIGGKLMQHILDWLGDEEDIYVVVAVYNEKAINFYKRFGFQATGKQVEDISAKQSGDKQIPEIEMVRRKSR